MLGQTHVYMARPPHGSASMERQAIARPNAKALERQQRTYLRLQWRAEQLLGQTRGRPRGLRQPRRFNGGPSNCSAKPLDRHDRPNLTTRFNGGPSNCSAKRRTKVSVASWWCELQWRAEQLLGQTLGSITPCAVTLLLQWRAEQLLGQTGGLGETVRVGGQASMEGRAIARPNSVIT